MPVRERRPVEGVVERREVEVEVEVQGRRVRSILPKVEPILPPKPVQQTPPSGSGQVTLTSFFTSTSEEVHIFPLLQLTTPTSHSPTVYYKLPSLR